VKATLCRNTHIPSIFLPIALGIPLFGSHNSQSAQPTPSPAEQQKLKDEQANTQKEMNTLTSGMGQSLSKTPAAPVTDPAAEWKKTHPQKQSPTTKPQTQPKSPAPPSSTDESKE
jgi:hypothetical protein